MKEDNSTPSTVDVKKVQKRLMDDDCYIPFNERTPSSINKDATFSHPVVVNGKERGDENMYVGNLGESLSITLNKPAKINGIRLVFDSDLNRKFDNMPCTYLLKEERYRTAKTMIKDFKLVFTLSDGSKETVEVKENFLRFVKVPFEKEIKKVELIPLSNYGAEKAHIFDFELL